MKMKKKSEPYQLPIVKSEDVEFSMELADHDDLVALQRAKEADSRQEKS